MAWIKVDHEFPDKPEVAHMAARLGLDHDTVVGKCLRWLIWIDKNSIDGTVTTTTMHIDRLTACPGFSDALLDCGWLIARSGSLSVPHFARHNGHSAKARALTSVRVSRSRNATSVTESLPDKSKRREEMEREGAREAISTEPEPRSDPPEFLPDAITPPASIALPRQFANDACREAWAEWQAHLRERDPAVTSRTLRMQLNAMAREPPERFVEGIRLAIVGGWKTLNPRYLVNHEEGEAKRNAAQAAKPAADNWDLEAMKSAKAKP